MGRDPYKYFRVEAREILDTLGRGLLDLEKVPSPGDLVPQLLRSAHTLKGAARVVKLPEIAEMAHAVEDALAPLREIETRAPTPQVDALLKQVDAIGERLERLPPAAVGAAEHRSRAPDVPPHTVRADVAEMDLLLDGISETHVQLGAMRRATATIERTRQVARLLQEQLGSPRATELHRSLDGGASARLQGLAEELRGLVEDFGRRMSGGVEQIEREIRQVRETAERLRLLPAGAWFAPLERTARDVAQALGKDVRFEARGGDVRLDAHVLGGIESALIQVVRNAVAHGIETGQERASAGKPRAGLVDLEVIRSGGRVTFRCRDDGRGVDVAAVRCVAESQGLLPHGSPELSSRALLELLLQGGLTTSGAVTELAGRGIGLDVVRDAVARLGGTIALQTEAGRGTTLELVVPISRSSVEVLLADCSGTVVAIPLDVVGRTLRLGAADVRHAPQGDSILHDGQPIPFVPLSRLLRPAGRGATTLRPWTAIVIVGGATVAAGVDRLLGTTTVVLRPLPALAPADPIVGGVWLDSNGDPQVLIDPHGLRAARMADDTDIEAVPARSHPPVLIVDDSLTTRMLERSILESAGYEVDVAASAEEALEKTRLKPYRMFVVDVEMPGMDGFTFVERTRADPRMRDVPAILVTSRNAPEDFRRGMEVGASAYMTKGEFDQSHLLDTIRKLSG